jgi:hypothetical protein
MATFKKFEEIEAWKKGRELDQKNLRFNAFRRILKRLCSTRSNTTCFGIDNVEYRRRA